MTFDIGENKQVIYMEEGNFSSSSGATRQMVSLSSNPQSAAETSFPGPCRALCREGGHRTKGKRKLDPLKSTFEIWLVNFSNVDLNGSNLFVFRFSGQLLCTPLYLSWTLNPKP